MCVTGADKWGMPLMGWLSAADTLNQIAFNMTFNSQEEAVRVAERNGAKRGAWCCTLPHASLMRAPACARWPGLGTPRWLVQGGLLATP